MRENGHATEVVTLMEGEWSCYRGGQFKGGSIVMLQRWSVYFRENGHVIEVASLMERENGHSTVASNGGRMVMLKRWSVSWRENSHVTEVASLMEKAWSCYRGGHFNGGKMVMLQSWSV